MTKVYIFRTEGIGFSGASLVRTTRGKVIHAVEADVKPKTVHFKEEEYKLYQDILGFKRNVPIGNGVYLTFDLAKQAATRMCAYECSLLEEKLRKAREVQALVKAQTPETAEPPSVTTEALPEDQK